MKALVLGLGVLFGSLPAPAADVCDNLAATGLDNAVVRKFENDLFAALKAGSAAKVASMVQYPISVTLSGDKKKTKLTSPKQFEKAYGKIFTDDFVAKVTTAPASDTVCRDQGVGLASGSVWVHAPDMNRPSDVKIIAINK